MFGELKTHQIRSIVDKQLRQHGLKRAGLSAQSLRRTVGQLLLEAGLSLKPVQQHLRHKRLETTQFYTRMQNRKTYFDFYRRSPTVSWALRSSDGHTPGPG